jgi:hypothetical protein
MTLTNHHKENKNPAIRKRKVSLKEIVVKQIRSLRLKKSPKFLRRVGEVPGKL